MNKRHSDILELLRATGQVSVDDLAARFSMTVQTIRRDLADLAQEGRLERVHGGAILPSGTANIAYLERRALNEDAKALIARAVALTIPDGSSLFLNIGTTTEAVATALLGHQGLLVVTNNLNVADILQAAPDCDVVLTGGRLRRSDRGLVGLQARRSVEDFRLDRAVIGCSALSLEGDFLDYDPEEVDVSRTMISHARERILVADQSKFQRAAPHRIGHLRDLSAFVTDAPLSDVLARQAQDWALRIVVPG